MGLVGVADLRAAGGVLLGAPLLLLAQEVSDPPLVVNVVCARVCSYSFGWVGGGSADRNVQDGRDGGGLWHGDQREQASSPKLFSRTLYPRYRANNMSSWM